MSSDALPIALTKEGALRFTVRVNPRSRVSAIDGAKEGVLRVRLHAPPIDGRANDELVALLAAVLGVPRADVQVISGRQGRCKGIEVRGVSAAVARERLERAAAGGRC